MDGFREFTRELRDFLLVGSLTPSAEVFRVQGEAEAAVVGHLLAAVDEDVDVVGIIQRLGAAPNDGEHGRLIGRRRQVGELHVVAVDRVAQQIGLHVRYLICTNLHMTSIQPTDNINYMNRMDEMNSVDG